MNVFDSSALLAFLQGEQGAGLVGKVLNDSPACSAANWSEVAQKIRAHGRNWDLAKALMATYKLSIEPVTAADAEWAARRWTSGEGLALADRLCMALGYRLGATIWTADQAWGTYGQIRQIR